MERIRKNAFRNFYTRLQGSAMKFIRAFKATIHLSDRNWKWISFGSLIFIVLFTLGYTIFLYHSLSFLWLLFATIMIVAWPLFFGLLAKLGILIVGQIPRKAGWLVFSAATVFFIYFYGSFKVIALEILYFLFTFIFIFGAISNINKGTWEGLSRAKKLLNFFFLTIGTLNLFIVIYFLVYPGPQSKPEENFNVKASFRPDQISLDDPSNAGNFNYSVLSYGTGNDKHRTEFGADINLESYSVNASAFIEGWDKFAGKLRTAYWGFGPDSLPLNGRMWLPDGQGVFPLVLIVHGNHLDRDFSDTGYEYIGKHLASHGYLTVSVDENFLNAGLMNLNHSLRVENDARAWLLLKHLELFRKWNNDTLSGLSGKIDLENIVLVGHSRGGEAVNIAASFNKLPFYPDDAMEAFDFNFGIKGIVSIAQVDGQYAPSNISTPVSNLNFLAIQGSLDADLESYSGLRMYNRIYFSDTLEHFKAGIYIQGANHGQFNTSWGINDIGYPGGLFLNRRRILDTQEQEKIALVYITAFVKSTFEECSGYKGLFSDYRSGREWLPRTKYLNQYQQSNIFMVADFEEDLDLSTVSDEQAQSRFVDLSKIYEQNLRLKKGDADTKSLVIGWNNESDSLPGLYEILFLCPVDILNEDLKSIQFDIALLNGDPGEREMNVESDEESQDTLNVTKTENRKKEKKDEKEEATSFKIELEDINGERSTVSLLDHFPLNPPIGTDVYKLKIFNNDSDPEIVPQHVEINLRYFYEQNASFQKENLRSIKFIFDEGKKGLIAFDNIGFTHN